MFAGNMAVAFSSQMPPGWKQETPGVLARQPSPHDTEIRRLKAENAGLKERLDKLEEMLNERFGADSAG